MNQSKHALPADEARSPFSVLCLLLPPLFCGARLWLFLSRWRSLGVPARAHDDTDLRCDVLPYDA